MMALFISKMARFQRPVRPRSPVQVMGEWTGPSAYTTVHATTPTTTTFDKCNEQASPSASVMLLEFGQSAQGLQLTETVFLIAPNRTLARLALRGVEGGGTLQVLASRPLRPASARSAARIERHTIMTMFEQPRDEPLAPGASRPHRQVQADK